MDITCTVHSPLSERNNKKYLELKLSTKDSKKVYDLHKTASQFLKNEKIKNPLENDVLEVKVPFRYNKVTCKVTGDKTIQELKAGDKIQINLEFCGPWNIGQWSGFAWKINELIYKS